MTVQNLARYKPAPNTSESRREVDWSKLSNENLKFALDTLELHHSPFVDAVLGEIQQRAARGVWLDIDQAPPPLHNVPIWLVKWLPRSLWRQKL